MTRTYVPDPGRDGHAVPIRRDGHSPLYLDSRFPRRRRALRDRLLDWALDAALLVSVLLSLAIAAGAIFGFIWILLAIGRVLAQGRM